MRIALVAAALLSAAVLPVEAQMRTDPAVIAEQKAAIAKLAKLHGVPNGATIKYVATIADGKWTEVGSYVGPGMPPVEFAKLEVARIGDTDWPATGFVTTKL